MSVTFSLELVSASVEPNPILVYVQVVISLLRLVSVLIWLLLW